MIHLEAKDTKDTEARNIPICDELFQHLVPMPNRVQGTGQESHVFQYNGKPVKSIAKALKKACEKAKIKYGRFVKDGFFSMTYGIRSTPICEKLVYRNPLSWQSLDTRPGKCLTGTMPSMKTTSMKTF
jgi:hypothetical protein